ncbi:uncharacterized protein G2W53_025694 [Senna tora]|uniref:Uncharacterized protein n=1 Tax=Senna tora TaxID=362788 RepID=A0A834TFW8_9FABA|nr:uncharacterized protein G2W53_025694 [Senna tora]
MACHDALVIAETLAIQIQLKTKS